MPKKKKHTHLRDDKKPLAAYALHEDAPKYGGCCDQSFGGHYGLFDNGDPPIEKENECAAPSVATLMAKQRSNSGGLFGFMERVFSCDKQDDAKDSKDEGLTQSLLK